MRSSVLNVFKIKLREYVRIAPAMRKGLLSAPLMIRKGAPPRVPVAPLSQLLDELQRDRDDR